MKHPIPIEVFEQHAVALGKTRSGKSYAFAGIIAQMLEAKLRVCVIDPKGDHFGLALSANGKSAGFPIVLFGDFKNADVPSIKINRSDKQSAHAGIEIAKLIISGNRPCVIGMRGWRQGEMTRFWIDFAETLFNSRLDVPLQLVIDEIQNFAPKGKIMSPEAGECLHWSRRLASEGSGLGIRLLSGSQRSAEVHNTILTNSETLIAMRATHPSAKEPIHEWLSEYGNDNERGKMVLSNLSEMQRGEAFVWSPEVKFFERVRFGKIETFDSYAPPKGKKQAELKGWAEVNLDEVKRRLAAVIEDGKANDPNELKKKIRELEQQLKKQPTTRIDESIVTRSVEQAKQQQAREFAAKMKVFEVTIQKQQAMMKRAAEMLVGVAVELPKFEIPKVEIQQRQSVPVVAIPPRREAERIAVPPSDGSLTNPEQRILDAIAWFNSIGIEFPDKVAVAGLAGYTIGGSKNPYSSARTKGLLDYGSGGVFLTESGRYLAKKPDDTLTDEDLHRKVMAVLSGPERRVLQPLIGAYPNSMTIGELSEASGYSEGGLKNPRSSLSTKGFIEYPSGGRVKAKSLLFPSAV